MFKRFVACLLCLISVFTVVSCSKPAERSFNPFLPEEPEEFDGTLRFNSDGTFKIMFLSDFHSDTWPEDYSLEKINMLLDAEQPDFIILGGDNTVDKTMDEAKSAIDTLISLIIERRIPWCHVYGNHDRDSLDCEDLQQVYLGYDYCVSSDVEELYGVGTYCLPIIGHDSDDVKFMIWCFDSHSNSEAGIYDDQVDWYKKTSEELENTAGKKVNGMMFCHIPVYELHSCVDDIIGTRFHGTCMEGNDLESSLDTAPEGFKMFDAIKERGDVPLFLFGHCHHNNCLAVLDGITLGYTGTVTGACFKTDIIRGSRVVIINENDTAHPETYFAFCEDSYYEFYLDCKKEWYKKWKSVPVNE